MTSIQTYRARIAALLAPLEGRLRSETIDLDAANMAEHPGLYESRVLARAVYSNIDLPRFDNSQMDGYAVLASDLELSRFTSLAVAPFVPAGTPVCTHSPGSATPVMTGAPIPLGADAVVPVERAQPPRFPDPSDQASVTFIDPIASGTFVRKQGSDLHAGELLLEAGTVLRAAQYGVLASTGRTSVEVRKPLSVLVVPTGQEIRTVGSDLSDWQIFDANGPLLAEALRDVSAKAIVEPCTNDEPEQFLALLESRVDDEIDLIITVGGVSAGAYEVVRQSLEPMGASFDHVDMQPGGPQGNGLLDFDEGRTGVPVVSLPGNPVSALISFEVFLRPILLRLAGRTRTMREASFAVLTESIDSPKHVHQIRRGIVRPDGRVTPTGGPGSHLLHHYAQSNALIHIPNGIDRVESGNEVEIWRIDD